MPKRKPHRKTRANRRRSSSDSTMRLVGNSTKALVGVTAFAITANALTDIAHP